MTSAIAGTLTGTGEAVTAPADFNRWMMAEQKRVFLLCCRLLGDRDEADMAAQDTFLKAYRALVRDKSPGVEDPGKWVTRIAVNTCLDRLRSRAWRFWRERPRACEEELILSAACSREPTAEARLFAAEIQRRLQEGLAGLSPRQRTVFVLRHYEDRSIEEIAGLLRLDEGTVKAHMSRALAKLRVVLRDLYGRGERSRDGSRALG